MGNAQSGKKSNAVPVLDLNQQGEFDDLFFDGGIFFVLLPASGADSEPTPYYTTSDGSAVGMMRLRVEEALLAYLQQTDIFQGEAELLEAVGFARCVDYPNVMQHVYYEGIGVWF
jgi:hypothetical protein